ERAGPDGTLWYRARRPGGREGWGASGAIVPWSAPIAPTVGHAPLQTREAGRLEVPVASATAAPAGCPMGAESLVNDPDGKGVQLRAAPDPDATPGRLLPNGTQVAILRFAVGPQGNAWAEVRAGDASGWAPVR